MWKKFAENPIFLKLYLFVNNSGKAFVSKLSDAEAEAAETQTWLDFTLKCGYINPEAYKKLDREYDHIIGKLVNMARYPEKWAI